MMALLGLFLPGIIAAVLVVIVLLAGRVIGDFLDILGLRND